MNKDDLLRPRYKVSHDYPHSAFEVGEILNCIPDVHFIDDFGVLKGTMWYSARFYFAKYPHLFQKLEWWQDREISELPEYVSYNKVVIKITTLFEGGTFRGIDANGQKYDIHLTYTLPCSVEEFNNFNEKK